VDYLIYEIENTSTTSSYSHIVSGNNSHINWRAQALAYVMCFMMWYQWARAKEK